jgi:hypothetical protein
MEYTLSYMMLENVDKRPSVNGRSYEYGKIHVLNDSA